MTEHGKTIADFLGCEYELFENQPNDEAIIARYNALTEEGKREGFIPLIVVADDVLAETLEMSLEDEDLENTPEDVAALRARILRDAETVDVAAFLAGRFAEYADMHSDIDIWGAFREAEPTECFFSHVSGGKALPEILIAKIPAKHPWDLAAWAPMGGFNDCPLPAEQVAVFKYWNEKYGAVPAVVTHDNWDFELKSPPTNDADAEALAKEHFAFCYDCVMQANAGWDTVRALASTLKNSLTWYFWWD
jgi:hypothetical protein